MKRLLVQIQPPGTLEGKKALLEWPKARGVPDGGGRLSKQILSGGMLCEIGEDDLDEAKTLGSVKVLGGKEVAYEGRKTRVQRREG